VQMRARLTQLVTTPATQPAGARRRRALDLVAKLLADRVPGAHDRGIAKVLTQAVLTAWVVNVKRMVKLLMPALPPRAATATVRPALRGA
jgi:hypothetical protein